MVRNTLHTYLADLPESWTFHVEVFNRPGVAGAVLQSPSSLIINSLIDSLTDAFPPDLQNISTPKP